MSGLRRLLEAVVHDGALHWLDTDGRPLGEQAAEAAYRAAATDERVCPFPDRRRGRVINASALRQITDHWDAILATVAHLGAVSVPAGQPVTLHRAWSINGAAGAIALWHGLTADSAGIPVAASALYKASLGFAKVFPELLLQDPDAAAAPLGERLSPEAFFDHLDTGGLLVGGSQVCAGSRAQILAYYDALLSPCRLAEGAPIGPPDADLGRFLGPAERLFALVAVWVATVGGFVRLGRLDEVPGYRAGAPEPHWPVGLRVFGSLRSPAVRLVRSHAFLDPVRVTWLCPEGRVPACVVRFLERVDLQHPRPLGAVDQVFLTEARPVVAALLESIGAGVEPDSITLEMFVP